MKQERNSDADTDSVITKSFIITGAYYGDKCFPGLNDMLHEACRHPKAYNQMKQQFQTLTVNAIRRQLRGFKAQGLIRLNMTFGEPRKGNKRDYDNIVAAARKIINDALSKTGTIKDDSPKYLGYGNNVFKYTDVPYIRVEIEEVVTPELPNFSR